MKEKSKQFPPKDHASINSIHSYDMSVEIAGTAFRTETYVHIRWVWLTAAVLFSTALLVNIAVGSRRLDVVVDEEDQGPFRIEE